MNYGHWLIEQVCKLTESDAADMIKTAYDKLEPKPDNFVGGYQIRLLTHGDTDVNDLSKLLEIYYNSSFKYEESVSCEGYAGLIDFLYALDGTSEDGKLAFELSDVIRRLDDISNENALYDIEGEKIEEDAEIRRMRNACAIYSLTDAEQTGKTLWNFMDKEYTDMSTVKKIVEDSDIDNAEELLAEWLVCAA